MDKNQLLQISGTLIRLSDQIKTGLREKIERGHMYPSHDPQFAQIDCRVKSCVFYKGSGICSNVAPAIVLNPNNSFLCKSKQVKEGF